MNDWWQGVKAVARAAQEHDLGAYAAALAYNFLFALPALALFLAALLGFLHLSEDPRLWFRGPLTALLPPALSRFLAQWSRDLIAQRHPALLSLGAVGFVWGTSGAFRQLIDAFNHVFDCPRPYRRSWAATTALALGAGVTTGLVLALVLGMALVESGRAGAPGAAGAARWAVLLAAMWGLLTGAYRYLPDRPQPVPVASAGTALAVGGWILGTRALALYTAWFHTFNRIYGGLGTVFLLMAYAYLTAAVVLWGAEVNAALVRLKMDARQGQNGREGHAHDAAHDGPVDADPL
ncbi:MAG: YihY/virulence factor BrkB family protein [Firmicutes bacterium]|nr:YihY/virulence factor BrkB family protein [Alicyclobacillaceae bacterium]MCL6498218.1 YihY/virulence factor BrkB family protein [Bacillota bacterium]